MPKIILQFSAHELRLLLVTFFEERHKLNFDVSDIDFNVDPGSGGSAHPALAGIVISTNDAP